ncbi:hypothetical protein V6U71_12115 [Sphingopyxis sp. J-6]|uniref:lipopolysaccharide biosynthesis protein n=1 Tax=Sphingopyxis sp. J-6 TaxID=3122054 RepID=UPI003983FB62
MRLLKLFRPASIGSGMILYGAGRGAAAAIGLGIALILPHFLSVDTLGQFYIMISATTYLSVVMRFGGEYVLFRQSAIETEVDKAKAWDSKAFGQATKYLLINCLLLLALAKTVLWSVDLSGWYNDENLKFLEDSLPQIFAISLGTSMLVYLYQISKVRALIVYSSLVKSSILNFIFIAMVVSLYHYTEQMGISSYVNLYLVASLLAVLVAVVLCRSVSMGQWVRGMVTANPSYYRSESWYSFSYSMLFVVFTELEILLASLYLSPADIAIYGTARRMTLACSIFVEFSNVFLPKIIAAGLGNPDQASLGRKLSSFSVKMAMMSLFVIASIWLFGEWAFGLVLPDSFAGVADLLVVLLFVPFIAVLLGPSEILLLMHSKENSRLILSLSLMVAIGIQFTVAATWLIPAFGIFGLAWSSVIAMAVYRTILTLYVHRYLSMRLFPGAR